MVASHPEGLDPPPRRTPHPGAPTHELPTLKPEEPVIRAWGHGAWKPLPGLPVVSQMPREQRREFERKGPDESNQQLMWLEGPALELDMLAIWR